MASDLVSQAWAEEYLGTTAKGIVSLIKQRKLKRHPLTGSFLKSDIERVHDEIKRELSYETDGTPMGQEQQTLGVQRGFRTHPNLV
jgi:hypothetical protein